MDLFTGERAVSVGDARLDISRFQKGIFHEEFLRRVACRQHAQHLHDCDPHAPDNWLSAKNGWVHGDALAIIKAWWSGAALRGGTNGQYAGQTG